MRKCISVVLVALMMLTMLTGCKKEPFDVEQYRSYVCYDCNLRCIDFSEGSVVKTVDYPGYSFSIQYRQPVDVSDDQFMWLKLRKAFPPQLSYQCYVFQNPENYVDVWTDWTIQEIQIFTSRYSIHDMEEYKTSDSELKVISTITDPDCLAELLTFVTSDEFQSLSEIYEDIKSFHSHSGYDFDGDPEKTTNMYIRVIFNESESIIWESQISCQQNPETGEMYLIMYKDTTEWDETHYNLGIDRDEFWVENLPNLEAFLLEAVETLREGSNNG